MDVIESMEKSPKVRAFLYFAVSIIVLPAALFGVAAVVNAFSLL